MNEQINQLQEKINQNEDEILNLDSNQIEELKKIYEAQVENLEEEIKKMQVQRDMYLFNIKMYEKGR